MQTQHLNNRVYAGFWIRLAAFLFDLVLVNLCLMVIRIPMFFINLLHSDNFLNRAVLFKLSTLDIVYYLLTVLYFVLTTYYSGRTLGKRVMRIRVISADEEKLDFMDILYRETIGRYLCSLLVGIGYLLVAVNTHKEGIHDMLADTRVIYEPVTLETPKEKVTPYEYYKIDEKEESQEING